MIFSHEVGMHIIGECEHCNKKLKIPKNMCEEAKSIGIRVSQPIYCSCGTSSNIIKPKRESINLNNIEEIDDDLIKCPKCKSTQITAGNKGFSLGKAAVGGLLIGPAGLLGGVLGSKVVMVSCLKCGHKWEAGK
ncbi:hypothetical protein KDC22_13305 [Paenibacillus tritici]|uniref:hypothetical protein n=1 Tax=Paenibacillus tritici TaxID=1873425 RepID=UPI001BACD472|nr:hypothetical protein [Paenibacillus tritici]QUL57355.1 hypothetical protein KDC22_13305 [Paenibacillus tritici]